mmetsp:Transcript_59334/g.164067  ORF Transcript_59334/g.164067 Transcript_59334/m.164067 type:complete len:166 (-) Transcript_59334:89-586(-)|eukprot:CAMPEP_0179115408 /NCGR_PEP_ID=MMETSP0796-20121207/54083_1 /TAXON_ID=73915 /ORGANISM="Pyrodinium bahamense, Strain pbaha01" /LENGTH=165 /DNA_ID=CAMNT_0020813655 /DNA_START=116 /DNA_END=613 /DNA_ORIENTATION=-
MAFVPRATALAAVRQRVAPRSALTVACSSGVMRLGLGGAWAEAALRPRLQPASAAAITLRTFCGQPGSIEDRVIKAVKRYAGMRIEELKNETTDSTGDKDKVLEALAREVTGATKWEDLGFDDLDKVEVLLEVEDEFNHVIPDDDADRIESVKESVVYLEKHLGS